MVREQWLVIVSTALVVVLCAGAVSLVTPRTYRASAQLFVTAQTQTSPVSGSQFAQDQVRSYAEIVNSPVVTAPVIEELGLDESPAELGEQIVADVPTDTAVLNISVEDSRAQRAAEIANAVAEQLTLAATELETPEGQTLAPVKVTVVKTAAVPTAPESPRPLNNLLMGLVLGLGLGLGLALMRNGSKNSVHAGR